jgi:hypothetical protein
MDDDIVYVSEMHIKLQVHPRCLYLNCINPNQGVEGLWKEGWMGNRVMLNPNGFPYINLKISPYSDLIRKDTHHTIHEIGFDYLTAMVQYYSRFYGQRFYDYLSIEDTLMWENRSCIRLAFNFKDYDYILYTVSMGEDLTAIGNKLHLNDYTIMRKNPSIHNYHDIHPGQVIKVPNFYNRKVEFWVDRATWLPLVQIVYDEKGLYEKYELRNFLLNPVLDPGEFSPDYKEYKF